MSQGLIFVFGSNLAGRHGAGAALAAYKNWGAEYGTGAGRTGNAYAIPTKDREIKTRPLYEIRDDIDIFLDYAKNHPGLWFLVTKIGCGLAGYTNADIAPMFRGATPNCYLAADWAPYL